MSLIKCPECGAEISDKAKRCVHCGCPVKAKKRKMERKQLIFLVFAAVCLFLCTDFLVLFLLTTNDTRTIFFQNNKYYMTATREIGESEGRTAINRFTYYHRLNADDDVVLCIYDNDSDLEFSYYLSNAEMRIEFFSKQHIAVITYKMTKNGVVISDSSATDETTVEIAKTMRELLNVIINMDLNGSCTIDDVLYEYYDYCNLIKSIKISGIVFSSVFFAGFGVFIALSLKNIKKGQRHKTEQTENTL